MTIELNWKPISFKNILIVVLICIILVILSVKNVPVQTTIQDSNKDNQEHQVDCARARDTSVRLIEDWVSYLDYQNAILIEQGCPTISHDDIQWYPWELSDDWTYQQLPAVEEEWSHARFKALANRYWLDPSLIWKYENKYHLTEWMILCIAITETSWGKRGAGENNIWNVWNTDSNPRWQSYNGIEESLDAIWRVLNNQYLWWIETLGCLSNWWSCIAKDNNWKRYATSDGNRERNMVNCLETIYNTDIDASILSFRTTYVPYQVLSVN